MNEALTFGPNGRRLIAYFEGEPRLKARLCEGSRWELSYGCTFWPDNRPVVQTDTCTIETHWELFNHAISTFEEVVRHGVTVPVTQNQFDALVVLSYNIGPEAFATSTVLRTLNENRLEDCAAAFGMFMKSTSTTPTKEDLKNPSYAAIIQDGRWIGPQGQPASYFRSLRGLLRRHYAEACLFSGYDWVEAVRDDEDARHVSLLIPRREWNPSRSRWEDRPSFATPWSEIEAIARLHPLDPTVSPAPPITAPPSAVEEEAAVLPAPPAPASPAPVPASVPAIIPTGTKPIHPSSKTFDEVGIDPSAPLKPLEYSERFMAAVRLMIGAFIKTAGRNTAAAGSGVATASAVIFEVAQQPMALPILIGGIAAGGGILVWGIGHMLHASALKQKKRAELQKSQALF